LWGRNGREQVPKGKVIPNAYSCVGQGRLGVSGTKEGCSVEEKGKKVATHLQESKERSDALLKKKGKRQFGLSISTNQGGEKKRSGSDSMTWKINTGLLTACEKRRKETAAASRIHSKRGKGGECWLRSQI